MSRVFRFSHLLLVTASLMLASGEVAFGQESDAPVADVDPAEPAAGDDSEDASMLPDESSPNPSDSASLSLGDTSFPLQGLLRNHRVLRILAVGLASWTSWRKPTHSRSEGGFPLKRMRSSSLRFSLLKGLHTPMPWAGLRAIK